MQFVPEKVCAPAHQHMLTGYILMHGGALSLEANGILPPAFACGQVAVPSALWANEWSHRTSLVRADEAPS